MNKLTKLIRIGLVLGLLLTSVSMAFAQAQTVNGKVVDESGQPVIGATVAIKGTSTGIVTDVDGNFSLNAAPKDVIVISYLGYTTQEITVGRKTSIDVTLKESDTQLKDVVVVGYGTQKKANLTGAVSTVDVNKSLVAKSFTDIGKGLQGTVPGLQITYSNGNITSAPTFQIRGLTSLNSANAPLILVDGIATDDVTSIAPNDIASISVLKDAASTSIFGARAVGGVVMITTKSGSKNAKFSVNYTDNFSWGNPTVIPSFPDPLVDLPMENAAMQRAGSTFDFWGADMNDMINGITNWKQNYAGKTKGNNMILGQDFTYTPDGPLTFYRLWNPIDIMYQTMPSQNHNVNFSGGTDRLSYYVSGSYSQDEGLLKPNPSKVGTYNLTASVTADATKWLTIQAKITDRQYNFNGPFINNGYVGSESSVLYEMWRWGTFVPYGTYTDPTSGNNYYWTSPLGFLKNAGTSTSKSNQVTSNFSATIKFTPWLNLHSDFSYVYNSTLANSYGGYTPMWDFWNPSFSGQTTTYNSYLKLYIVPQSSMGDFYTSSYKTQITSNTFLTFEKKFGPSNWKATGGLNMEKGEYVSISPGGYNLMDPTKGEPAFLQNTIYSPYLNIPGVVTMYTNTAQGQPANQAYIYANPYLSGSHTWWSVAGYFARANYDYNNKYLVEVDARYDGSSNFPTSGMWAFFPSASAGWRITEESFMKDIKTVINDWKIRASYGTIGNQAVNNFYMPLMTTGPTNWINQNAQINTYVGLPQNVPKSLTWERVNTGDIGTDMRFLNNNLGLTFDWYQKENVGMITQEAQLPATYGGGTIMANNGDIRTDGWELGLDYHYRLHNGIELYANAALSNYMSKVIKIGGNDQKLLNYYYNGEVLGTIWGFKTVGFFKDAADVANSPSQVNLQTGSFVYGPGDIKYADLNNNGKIDWGQDTGTGALTADNHGDLTKIGNITPQYQYSFRLGGDWKGVDLDAYFQGVGKQQMWATGNVPIPGYGGNGQFLGNQMNYWTPENPNAYWPALYYGNNGIGPDGKTVIVPIPYEASWSQSGGYSDNNFYPQTKYLLNMAYLRVKTLTLGYTLPARLTEKLQISKFRVYVEGMNLFTFWANQIPIDPEISSGASGTGGSYYGITYPFNKTYSFGVQLTF